MSFEENIENMKIGHTNVSAFPAKAVLSRIEPPKQQEGGDAMHRHANAIGAGSMPPVASLLKLINDTTIVPPPVSAHNPHGLKVKIGNANQRITTSKSLDQPPGRSAQQRTATLPQGGIAGQQQQQIHYHAADPSGGGRKRNRQQSFAKRGVGGPVFQPSAIMRSTNSVSSRSCCCCCCCAHGYGQENQEEIQSPSRLQHDGVSSSSSSVGGLRKLTSKKSEDCVTRLGKSDCCGAVRNSGCNTARYGIPLKVPSSADLDALGESCIINAGGLLSTTQYPCTGEVNRPPLTSSVCCYVQGEPRGRLNNTGQQMAPPNANAPVLQRSITSGGSGNVFISPDASILRMLSRLLSLDQSMMMKSRKRSSEPNMVAGYIKRRKTEDKHAQEWWKFNDEQHTIDSSVLAKKPIPASMVLASLFCNDQGIVDGEWQWLHRILENDPEDSEELKLCANLMFSEDAYHDNTTTFARELTSIGKDAWKIFQCEKRRCEMVGGRCLRPRKVKDTNQLGQENCECIWCLHERLRRVSLQVPNLQLTSSSPPQSGGGNAQCEQSSASYNSTKEKGRGVEEHGSRATAGSESSIDIKGEPAKRFWLRVPNRRNEKTEKNTEERILSSNESRRSLKVQSKVAIVSKKSKAAAVVAPKQRIREWCDVVGWTSILPWEGALSPRLVELSDKVRSLTGWHVFRWFQMSQKLNGNNDDSSEIIQKWKSLPNEALEILMNSILTEFQKVNKHTQIDSQIIMSQSLTTNNKKAPYDDNSTLSNFNNFPCCCSSAAVAATPRHQQQTLEPLIHH